MDQDESEIAESFPKTLSGNGSTLVIDTEATSDGPLFVTSLTNPDGEVILDGAFDTYEDAIAFYTNLASSLSAIFG